MPNWFADVLGLVVSILVAYLLAPLVPYPGGQILYVLAVIAAVVFAVLLLIALIDLVIHRRV